VHVQTINPKTLWIGPTGFTNLRKIRCQNRSYRVLKCEE
jgi:hypothetical protein